MLDSRLEYERLKSLRHDRASLVSSFNMALSGAKLSRTRRKRLHCRLSIFGIGDSNKIHCGIQKNATYLDGKRNLTTTRREFFCLYVGNSRNAATANQPGGRPVVSSLLSCLPLRFFRSFPPLRHTKI